MAFFRNKQFLSVIKKSFNQLRFSPLENYAPIKNILFNSTPKRNLSQAKEIFKDNKKLSPILQGLFFLSVGCSGVLFYYYLKEINTLDKTAKFLESLDIFKELEGLKPDSTIEDIEGYVSRPAYATVASKRFSAGESLTQNTLRTPFRIPFPPRVYYNDNLKQSIELIYIGPQLVNEAGYIHEGLLTSLLDESFSRVAFLQFYTAFMFTANLQVNVLKQHQPNNFIKVITRLVPSKENKPYKAVLEAEVFDLNNALIATASSVFVVPKEARSTIGSLQSQYS